MNTEPAEREKWTLPRWISSGAALLASGCMVGPDYHAPAPRVPAHFINPTTHPATQASITTQRPVDVVQWWKQFNDTALDGLVQRTVEANLDLRQAEARLWQARATRGVVGSALLPNLNSSANYHRSGSASGRIRTSTVGGKLVTSNNAFRQDSYQAGFDSTWEIDLFGGIRRNLEAADANVQAAVEDRRDVFIILVAEVAVNYISLRGFQRQISIAEENLAAQQRTADLTRKKFGAGFVSRLDVVNADLQVFTTQADIPQLEASAQQTIYALSVLMGREPGALLEELSAPRPVPLTPPDVPIGLPVELLRRRPDIRRAEAQLHAATAQVGVATAQLYPQLNLVGSLDIQASKLRGLGNWSNSVWSIGPSLSWPIFAGGRITANIQVQNALQEQALIAYQRVVLTALQDVENALIAYSKEHQSRKALVEEVAAVRQALELSTRLYNQGQTDFLNVLIAERSLFSAETALAVSDTRIATDLAAVYKALGGGWQAEAPAATQPAAK